jgi:hypothetical protein
MDDVTTGEVETMLGILHKIINGKGQWQDRKEWLEAQCSEGDRANLEELSNWFITEE